MIIEQKAIDRQRLRIMEKVQSGPKQTDPSGKLNDFVSFLKYVLLFFLIPLVVLVHWLRNVWAFLFVLSMSPKEFTLNRFPGWSSDDGPLRFSPLFSSLGQS